LVSIVNVNESRWNRYRVCTARFTGTSNVNDAVSSVIRQLRADVVASGEKFGDAGTADFLTGLMEQHEKMAWMLRAVLEAKN